jgi:DNA-binding CsgD family transcriptional regulator
MIGMGMNRGLLRMADARRLWRLVAEASELPPRSRAQRQHLIEGITSLLGARMGAAVVDVDFGPRGRGRIGDYVGVAGSDGELLHLVDELTRRGSRANPAVDALFRAPAPPGEVTTHDRSEIVCAGAWYRCEFVQEVMRPARLDHGIYSCCPTSRPDVAGGLAIYRAWGDPPFEEEDRNLVHLFHVHAAALLLPAPTPDEQAACAGLSRRQRQVLEQLLSGQSEKEIADRLALSPYTVHDYVKDVYRAFGVGSRAQLLARFIEPQTRP